LKVSFNIRSLLFVPGSRPERFAKAIASGADWVCVDLEDAVAADGKDVARSAALKALNEPRVALRMNGLKTRAGIADLHALSYSPPHLLFVPMVENTAELYIVASLLGNKTMIIPLIETVVGLREAPAIAAAPGVVAMMFGGADFAAQLGVALAWEPLVTARSQFVMACAGANIPAIDVPWIHLDDADGLAEEARHARALGFSAKAAIHPNQIETINRAFGPKTSEIDEAKAAIAAFEAGGGSAVRHNGALLEAPMMARYYTLIEQQGATHA